MDLKGFLLSITLLILAYHDHAAAHVGLYKNNNYLRSDIAEYSRRFMIPMEGDSESKNHHKIPNINEYNDIANKMHLENLEQSLNKEMRTTESIIHKIVSVPKKCFGLAKLHSYGPKRPGPRRPKTWGKEDETDNKKYAVDILDNITKIVNLENLEQSLGTELSKANWIINKIISIAKDCYGAEERPNKMENEDAIMNKLYDMITNKTALLEVLQLQLDSNIHKVEDFINHAVDITKYCLGVENSHTENLRSSTTPNHRENVGHDDALINNDIYDEIANKTARLEILRKAFRSKMVNVESTINKTVEISEFCFGLEAHRPEIVRRKRDVSVVGKVPVAKNDTKTDANATDGRRSMYRMNRERTEIQQKLLNYIYDAFKDIDTKMQALNVTKEQFANDERYAIGYIMANIDTLKVNLANIKKRVEANRDLWNDMEILEVYDTVKNSDKTLLKLHRILNLLMMKGSNKSPV